MNRRCNPLLVWFFFPSRVTITTDGTLILQNISKSDEGKYTCFAENFMGKANSTGILSVRGRDVCLDLGSVEQEMSKNAVIFLILPQINAVLREPKTFQPVEQPPSCLTHQTTPTNNQPLGKAFPFSNHLPPVKPQPAERDDKLQSVSWSGCSAAIVCSWYTDVWG